MLARFRAIDNELLLKLIQYDLKTVELLLNKRVGKSCDGLVNPIFNKVL